jgi:hypothetical protein
LFDYSSIELSGVGIGRGPNRHFARNESGSGLCQHHPRAQLFEIFFLFDMDRAIFEFEPHMMTAILARRKGLAEHTCHFMR